MRWILVLLALFSLSFGSACARRPQKQYIPPTEAEGRRCTMVCRQIQNQCVQMEIEEAKQYSRTGFYEAYLDRTGCDRDYDQCFLDCGGQVR